MADKHELPTAAHLEKLRKAGLTQIDILDDHLKAQVSLLSDHEIAALAAIKLKLNSNLAGNIKHLADTVGGFIW
jgi:hypothetical protein